MKAMTTSEKFQLIRHHGGVIAGSGVGARSALRSEILESAQRVIELTKSISKHEFGVEDDAR